MNPTSLLRQAATILCNDARFAKGFSARTCLPFLAEAIAISSRTLVGVAM
jgi:hypothetical protein